MSFRPFEISASGELTAQPTSAGEKLVIVSDNTADTGDTVTVRGLVSAAASSNTVTLSTDGRIEKETTDAFESLTGISTSGLTGIASIYGQGTAGQGDNRITTIPATAQTLLLGLGSTFYQTYTFRSPCRETILCPAGSALVTGASAASYVKLSIDGTAHYFWFSNGVNSDPAPGGTGHSVTWNATDTVLATNLAAAIVAVSGFCYADSAGTATVTVTGIVLGALTATQDGGNDFTLTAVEAGTANAANQIRTTYDVDGSTATPTDVALWIQYAVNASGGTAGMHYGTGTAANAYVTASAASETTTFTDRIACSRNLGWTVTAPSGSTARTVIGGAYGTLLATITSTDTIRVAQDFNNPALADDTLLALYTGETDGILTNGLASVLRLAINNVSSAVVLKVQASEDDTTYYDISGTTALTGTVAGTAAAYTLTGTSTLFTTELKVGDWIVVSTYAYRVASIASDTSLAVEQPLVTSPSGTSAAKRLPVQLAYLDNNSQFIQLPQCEYVRLNFTTNSNTTDSKLHAGLIV